MLETSDGFSEGSPRFPFGSYIFIVVIVLYYELIMVRKFVITFNSIFNIILTNLTVFGLLI